MKVYVASSWRNERQPEVVEALREARVEVYDFRAPDHADGFHWSEIDPDWQQWTPEQLITNLGHSLARLGFGNDMGALQDADACVLVMPCGRSAHLELGYAVGVGKPTAILLSDGEPELMYRMVDYLATDLQSLVAWVKRGELGLAARALAVEWARNHLTGGTE